jgi:hypothetical protein
MRQIYLIIRANAVEAEKMHGNIRLLQRKPPNFMLLWGWTSLNIDGGKGKEMIYTAAIHYYPSILII